MRGGGIVGGVCGRYVASRSAGDLLAEFEADLADPDDPAGWDGGLPAPSWNVAPTDRVPVVLPRRDPPPDGPRRLVQAARWGLVPHWAREVAGGGARINARAETAGTLPTFRSALARRRCLIPADGWYEWTRSEDGSRQPYYLTSRDGAPLAFAGLWARWYGAEPSLLSCAILTTAAVGPPAAVHCRMPLLLPRHAWDRWLDPDRPPVPEVLRPPASALVDALQARPVGRAVGNVAARGPDLVRPVEPAAPAPVPLALFD